MLKKIQEVEKLTNQQHHILMKCCIMKIDTKLKEQMLGWMITKEF